MRAESIILDHPLAVHHLGVLRDRASGAHTFRSAARRLATLLAVEATRDLRLIPTAVETPLAPAPAARLAASVAIVPILRAGLAMVDPLIDLIPEAQVWHLGVYRDEQSLHPVQYYNKLPEGRAADDAIVIDPMLATGGSADWAIAACKDWGARRIKLLSLIAAPEGVARVRQTHPDVGLYVGAVDDRLNDNGYIVPGLGDAGDRAFNTCV